MINFDGIAKTYADGTTAVEDLDLEIEDGSLTVFVGPSGCGKTTSLRMINKMITPTRGTITVGGQDISMISAVQLRLGIGYVIQDGGLLPHRTVLDNVATVLRLKGVSVQESRRRAQETMERVGLRPELTFRYPSQLSGGQQQRVGVARALAADPPVLLMDEPFSAVDPVVRDELQQEMLRLQREIKKTIVLVTHDMDEALLLGDKIAVFGPGGVMQQYADAETVLTRPANPFVATMISKDRGFRSLSFRNAEQVPIEELPSPNADGVISLREFAPGWDLVVDGARRPLSWLNVTSGEHIPVGTTLSTMDSLRRALDAVLSSPASLGIVLDHDGGTSGLIRSANVLRSIESSTGARL